MFNERYIIIKNKFGKWESQPICHDPYGALKRDFVSIDKKDKIVVFKYQYKVLSDTGYNSLAYTTLENWEKRHTPLFDGKLIEKLSMGGRRFCGFQSFQQVKEYLVEDGFSEENILEETYNNHRRYIDLGIVQDIGDPPTKDEIIESFFRKIGMTKHANYYFKDNESFINDFFAILNLKGERTKYVVSDEVIVWIDFFDNEDTSKRVNNHVLTEDFSDIKDYQGVPVFEFAKKYPYCIVIDKKEKDETNEYRVKGIYKFDEQRSIPSEKHFYNEVESTSVKHYYDKI